MFKRSILVSLFFVLKVLKHFLDLNTDENVSTVLIKNGFIIRRVTVNSLGQGGFLGIRALR